MMRMNGQLDSDESSGTEIDEMAENESSLLVEKIEELEKKILNQGDEIICLRSTLANVVRRLEQVEATSKGESWSKFGNNGTKNGANRSSFEYGVLRQPGFSFASKVKEPLKKSFSTTNSSLLHRRQTHYQSTGSLHSGQSNNSEPNSSNSGSPIPVSPSASTHSGLQPILRVPGTPNTFISLKTGEGKNNSNRGNSQSLSTKKNTSNLHNSKRWSSTGDFALHTQIPSPSPSSTISRSSAKSLLNLFPRHQPSAAYMPLSTQVKRGMELVFDESESLIKMYLRGRPIVMNLPTAIADNYDVNEVVKPPPERLKLDWVYGYRGRDCRSNLYFLPTGEMIYFIASVVVLYNVEEQSQRHYLGHTDDVKCLAIHPNKMVVATGQCAGHDRRDSKPHIRIWNSVSLHTLAVIGLNEFEKSICCITFSRVDGGALLCVIDESMDHTISVWDWQKKEKNAKLTENKCSVDTVIAAEFHPLDRHCIVTCGRSHIAFWILDQNGTLYKRMGIFENRDKPKYVTCLAFTQDGDTLSGDSNGNIIVWGRGTNTIMKLIRGVHDSAIFSICPLKDGIIITGGGKDGKLVMLNSEFLPIDEGYIGERFGGIRQVSESRGSQLLIGTTKNCILIGSFAVGFTPVSVGHTEEIWACTPHPNLPQFLTAGFDGIIHLWDSLAHSLIWTKEIGESIQSVRFSPDGAMVIIGLCNGKWCVLDCEKREILSSYQDGNEPIQDCKFSPDKTTLALGSRDNTIYVYQTSPNFTNYHKIGRCVGHSSFIKHIDWSVDSQYLRSNSGDYELLYWQASICRQFTHTSAMKDVEWATNDCTITFNTLGIWQDGMDGTDINSCSKSNNSKLLVTGDDFGKLKLYSYPVNHSKSLFHMTGGHSSHVTNVEFLSDDSRIVSVGGKDMSVMQWKIS